VNMLAREEEWVRRKMSTTVFRRSIRSVHLFWFPGSSAADVVLHGSAPGFHCLHSSRLIFKTSCL
jgi:hypothetical protein